MRWFLRSSHAEQISPKYRTTKKKKKEKKEERKRERGTEQACFMAFRGTVLLSYIFMNTFMCFFDLVMNWLYFVLLVVLLVCAWWLPGNANYLARERPSVLYRGQNIGMSSRFWCCLVKGRVVAFPAVKRCKPKAGAKHITNFTASPAVKFAWFEALERVPVKVPYFEVYRRVVWYIFVGCSYQQGKK